MASYLPLSDEGIRSWSSNFSGQAEALVDPTTVGLTPEQVTLYGAVSSDYDGKLAAATEPATRGSGTILAKNEAKRNLIALSRELAMIVTNHPGVTNQQRHDFGLTVPDEDRTPVPVPATSPVIDLGVVTGHRIRLRLHSGDSGGRAKPEGVAGATLFSYVGAQTPAEISDWKFEGNVTRTNTTLEIAPTVPPGSKVWITAFWFNTKAQSGPASPPVSTYIGGGLAQAA